jgi:predicted nucleotide-binding protein
MTRAWGDGIPASMITTDLEVATSLVKQAERERDTQISRQARIRNARQLLADELSQSTVTVSNQPRGAPASTDISRNVFVVHVRDSEARQAIRSVLQALRLNPMDWERLVTGTGTTTPTIMEVVRTAPGIAQATVVLMTPDDVVQLHPNLARDHDPMHETEVGGQPRPNVILELGMALMVAPERTIILEFGSLRPISDLAGLHVIRFDGSARSIIKLTNRLRLAGCPVDTSDTHLFDTGRFTELRAFTRGPDTIVDSE